MNRKIRAYLKDLAERTGSTFAEAFGAALIAGGAFSVGGIGDLSIWESAALSGAAAVLAFLKGLAATAIGDRRSASLVPSVPAAPPEFR